MGIVTCTCTPFRIRFASLSEALINWISTLEVLLANLFWGFGFTATVWSLQTWSILQILVLRFCIVGFCGLLIALIVKPKELGRLLKLTFVPALFLITEIVFQVWGLEHTSATKAGFLFGLYIIIVPLLEGFFFKRKIHLYHWMWVFVALLGTFLMIEIDTFEINIGDLLVLVSSLGASLHILSIDKVGKTEKNLFIANALQSTWGAILILPLLLLQNTPWPTEAPLKPLLGLLSLTFGSTFLAFYLQMRAQKNLSASIASVLFLLESPFAAIFGYFLLAERLNSIQWIGCSLIVIAAAGITTRHFFQPKNLVGQNTMPAETSDI